MGYQRPFDFNQKGRVKEFKTIAEQVAILQSRGMIVYSADTEFGWLYGLFRFDRELRQITFSYLIQAEATLKTATVYAFCDKHRGCSDYLDHASLARPRIRSRQRRSGETGFPFTQTTSMS